MSIDNLPHCPKCGYNTLRFERNEAGDPFVSCVQVTCKVRGTAAPDTVAAMNVFLEEHGKESAFSNAESSFGGKPGEFVPTVPIGQLRVERSHDPHDWDVKDMLTAALGDAGLRGASKAILIYTDAEGEVRSLCAGMGINDVVSSLEIVKLHSFRTADFS